MPANGSTLGVIATVLIGALLSSCGGEGRPTGVATNPSSGDRSGSTTGSPSSGSIQTSGARTVLSPIGLNIRSDSAPTAPPLGTAGRGTLLTVIDHTERNGGWYKVKGETTTGWITADPDLTAPGHFSNFESDQLAFNALYPDQWTFVNEPGDVVFKPQSGPQAILVRPAGSLTLLGPAGRAGYAAATQADVVVCGTTGSVVGYDRQGNGSGPSPAAGRPAPSGAPPVASGVPPVVSAPPLAHFSQLRLKLDATHALEVDYNYDAPDQFQAFKNFFFSVTFPFPQCMQTASPEPSAAPRAPGAPL